jgi:hypothetical protein
MDWSGRNKQDAEALFEIAKRYYPEAASKYQLVKGKRGTPMTAQTFYDTMAARFQAPEEKKFLANLPQRLRSAGETPLGERILHDLPAGNHFFESRAPHEWLNDIKECQDRKASVDNWFDQFMNEILYQNRQAKIQHTLQGLNALGLAVNSFDPLFGYVPSQCQAGDLRCSLPDQFLTEQASSTRGALGKKGVYRYLAEKACQSPQGFQRYTRLLARHGAGALNNDIATEGTSAEPLGSRWGSSGRKEEKYLLPLLQPTLPIPPSRRPPPRPASASPILDPDVLRLLSTVPRSELDAILARYKK